MFLAFGNAARNDLLVLLEFDLSNCFAPGQLLKSFVFRRNMDPLGNLGDHDRRIVLGNFTIKQLTGGSIVQGQMVDQIGLHIDQMVATLLYELVIDHAELRTLVGLHRQLALCCLSLRRRPIQLKPMCVAHKL